MTIISVQIGPYILLGWWK